MCAAVKEATIRGHIQRLVLGAHCNLGSTKSSLSISEHLSVTSHCNSTHTHIHTHTHTHTIKRAQSGPEYHNPRQLDSQTQSMFTHQYTMRTTNKNRATKAVKDNSSGDAGQR